MQGYNIIVVFNKSNDKLLMCKRAKNPYKGLSNFVGDENELYWSEIDCDFFDTTQYAGEGNIGHIIEIIHNAEDRLLRDF